MNKPAETGVATVNGAELHYEIRGSGPALVLIHAGIADRRMWDEQVAAFAEHFRVIRYDLRGFGATVQPRGEFSHLADLAGLLEALGVGRTHVLGCSKGGSIALDYALEYPERTGAVVFVASVPSGYTSESDVPPAQWEEMVAAYKAGNFERAAALEAEIWVAGPSRTAGQVEAGILRRVAEMDVIALRNEAAELGQERPAAVPAVKRLGRLAEPLLIVAGDLDDPDVVAAGEWLAAQVPGARRVVVSGTAHFPNMERPEAFNRVVLEFLSRRL
ncbi:MAG: alpha/beta fold hydrolase [Anaerolineales bacterium]